MGDLRLKAKGLSVLPQGEPIALRLAWLFHLVPVKQCVGAWYKSSSQEHVFWDSSVSLVCRQ